MICTVYQLGRIGYREAYYLQRQLLQQRVSGSIGDTLLILEHPHTITIGKSGKLQNILVSHQRLQNDGISIFSTDRGGDVTYHGPGQLVVYPIIDLRDRGKHIRQYVHDIEEVIIRTLSDFGIRGCRSRSHPGVWVRNEQIATIGLRIKKWVTMHGFALNVNTDLEKFSLINPCGCSDIKATSCSRLLSRKVLMEEVTTVLLAHFSEVFNSQIEIRASNLIRSLSWKADYPRGSSRGVQTPKLCCQ